MMMMMMRYAISQKSAVLTCFAAEAQNRAGFRLPKSRGFLDYVSISSFSRKVLLDGASLSGASETSVNLYDIVP
jgi:hypothetical protein